MITNIAKWGNSQAIRIPKQILDSLSLSDNDTVDISIESNSIVIKKAEPRYMSIQERFKDFDGVYEPNEIDWGAPVGNEVW